MYSNCVIECHETQVYDGCAKPCGKLGTCSNPPVDFNSPPEEQMECLDDVTKVASCVCKDHFNNVYDPVTETCIPKNQCPARGILDFL